MTPQIALALAGLALLAVVVLAGLLVIGSRNPLLFHSLAELFSIVVACSIFLIVWNTRRLLDNSYLLFIGVAYLFVAGLDLVHALAYQGMGVFGEPTTNLAAQLWIAARFMESLSLLIATWFSGRRLRIRFVLSSYVAAFVLILLLVFHWRVFPVCFVEREGLTGRLTPFKVISEYVICLILLASIVQLSRRRAQFDPEVLWLVIASIAITIVE